MRRFCILIALLLLAFPAIARAGIDEMSDKGYRLTKESAFYNSKRDQKYYLLFYTGSTSETNGKFLLVDADLNILAETPYAYNLYTFCPNIKFCYFMPYRFGFLAKQIWQLDLDAPAEKSQLIDLYSPDLSNKQAEEELLQNFLKNRTEQEFVIAAPPEKFSRTGTFAGIQSAPSWMRYASPFMLVSVEFLAAFFAFLLLRRCTVERVSRADATGGTAQMLMRLVTVCYGLALCIGVAMTAPGIYGFLFLFYCMVHGFSFKKKPRGKDAAVPPEKTAA